MEISALREVSTISEGNDSKIYDDMYGRVDSLLTDEVGGGVLFALAQHAEAIFGGQVVGLSGSYGRHISGRVLKRQNSSIASQNDINTSYKGLICSPGALTCIILQKSEANGYSDSDHLWGRVALKATNTGS